MTLEDLMGPGRFAALSEAAAARGEPLEEMIARAL
jgi:hypothetical protein